MPRCLARPLIFVAVLSAAGPAAAQEGRPTFAEEPTGGLNLPTLGIAGSQGAFTTVTNPAGLALLGGPHLGAAFDFAGEGDETTSGAGGGFFLAGVSDNPLFRLGYGLGVEFLRPPRVALEPDPGEPTRFTAALALPTGDASAFGFSWHHFFDDDPHPLEGLDTFDFGYTTRVGAHWAAGFAVRDLFRPTVDGSPVQRRYELELVSRPLGTDRLELGLGGRLGETRTDLDGWLRGIVRVARGVYLRGELAALELHELERTASGTVTEDRHEYRATLGLELSFGGLGATGLGTGAFGRGEDSRMRGGTVLARVSTPEIPSVFSAGERIEKVELEGRLDQKGLTRTVTRLRHIARDDKVVAVFLHLDGLSAGWATVHELRRELARVKSAGKKVFAYMVAGTTGEYFLATVADKIYVDPAGGIRLQGFSATALYFKGLFDKLGVAAQFQKIEEYKSAPESFTRTGPTEAALSMRTALYDSLYAELVQGIAEGRGLSSDRVRTLIDNGPYTAGDLAKQPDLVDRVVEPEELTDLVAEELGDHYPYGGGASERAERWSYPEIAVIFIEGDIVDGASRQVPLLGRRLVGGETIASAIAAARADPDVKAIVLRIDSPGGSALASELMAREVFKTKGIKPILCSMGDLAASGGYFAAAGCDRILADPMTITGSIGIFNGTFDLSALLSRVGISWQTYKRGERADSGSIFRALTDEERKLMKSKLHYYYGRFIKAVSKGRGMSTEQVDEIGRGRVWTGAQAKKIDLVDRFGGIGDAIAEAKQLAGMDPEKDLAQLVFLPKSEQSLFSRLLGGNLPFGGERGARTEEVEPLVRALLPGGAAQGLWQAIPASVWVQPGVPQARLPFTILWD